MSIRAGSCESECGSAPTGEEQRPVPGGPKPQEPHGCLAAPHAAAHVMSPSLKEASALGKDASRKPMISDPQTARAGSDAGQGLRTPSSWGPSEDVSSSVTSAAPPAQNGSSGKGEPCRDPGAAPCSPVGSSLRAPASWAGVDAASAVTSHGKGQDLSASRGSKKVPSVNFGAHPLSSSGCRASAQQPAVSDGSEQAVNAPKAASLNWADDVPPAFETSVPPQPCAVKSAQQASRLSDGSALPASASEPAAGETPRPSGILCISSIRGTFVHLILGALSDINGLAKRANAFAVIHVGEFGFYDELSFQRLDINDLRNAVQSSNQVALREKSSYATQSDHAVRNAVKNRPQILSELQEYVTGAKRLDVPVYVVLGCAEDLHVVERIVTKACSVPNLHIVDALACPTFFIEDTFRRGELHTVRVLGFGGAVRYDRLLDAGEGTSGRVTGTSGYIWSTLQQAGELLAAGDQPSREVRIFASFASPSHEGLVSLLARALKADVAICAGHSLRYCQQYQDAVVHTDEAFARLLHAPTTEIPQMWRAARESLASLPKRSVGLIDRVMDVLQMRPVGEELHVPLHLMLCDVRHGEAVLRMHDRALKVETLSMGAVMVGDRRGRPFASKKGAAAPPAVWDAAAQEQLARKASADIATAINTTLSRDRTEYSVIVHVPPHSSVADFKAQMLDGKMPYASVKAVSSARIIVGFSSEDEAASATSLLEGALFSGECLRTTADYLERPRGTSFWANELRRHGEQSSGGHRSESAGSTASEHGGNGAGKDAGAAPERPLSWRRRG